MATAILVVPTEQRVGLTTVALGLVHALDREGIPVGFCKPISQPHATDTGPERSTRLARIVTSLNPPEPISVTQTENLLGHDHENVLLEEVIARYEQAAQNASVVVVEGLMDTEEQSYGTPLNAKMARSLDAKIIIVTAPGRDTPRQVADTVEVVARAYGGIRHERMIGCILNLLDAPVDPTGHIRFDFSRAENGYDPSHEAEFRSECARHWPETFKLLGCVPWQRDLIAPRVQDIMHMIDAQALYEGHLDRRVTHVVLGAGTLANSCKELRPGALVIIPGDRDDLLLAVCMAAMSGTHVAAVLLTGGVKPDPRLWKLCGPALDTGLPVLTIAYGAMQSVLYLPYINLEIPLDDRDRMQRAVAAVASHITLDWKEPLLANLEERRLSPPAFQHMLVDRARRASKRVILPEGNEPRTIEAAIICHQRGLARCVLLGDAARMHRLAARRGMSIPPDIEIIDPTQIGQRYIDAMVDLRQHKGLTAGLAEEQLHDPVVLGTVMLQLGEVDGLVSGAVHTTANTIRPALQLIKTAPGVKLVSSVFFMCLPEQVLVYGDCAININPNADELADIAIQSAESAKAFGITPRVAMLSYSTGASGSGSDVEKIKEATRIARERRPDLLIDGPLQYDAAAIKDVAQSKAPDSQVAGRATVFIFPDLNTGNTTYKAVQRSADVISIGPMLQGLRKPVNDLSRGALVEDIVFTIALTAIQAEQATELERAARR
ncbi:phosphate acetyltransferase [Candidatus Contendibacter odensensis]|uniref:Phosphate acetyltransferase n=1 Tax=Candidatus Contendobacter odensis Run_B_J11 TaxID=1400861 RepID=A0A7U7GGH9_9GAMM|nr:phosphate acetyltransferase [Candidatus Contendobacter odensis]MBK8752531.1 phosphate acetyltransferase [Candidatus Competibacteraceae bacterium]CDH47723.1 Phosphate acetyltransferase [Candidatus Contendobacter odensis Run_B_J11]